MSSPRELAEDVDLARARGAKERAEEALRADADDEVASAALRRAEVRILVAEAATKR